MRSVLVAEGEIRDISQYANIYISQGNFERKYTKGDEEVYVTVERKQRGIGKLRKHTEKIKQGILKIKRVKESNI